MDIDENWHRVLDFLGSCTFAGGPRNSEQLILIEYLEAGITWLAKGGFPPRALRTNQAALTLYTSLHATATRS